MTTKKKLVVIGNGMAGARLVEDLIARGGSDMFEFVMFGDEPYGNYNRILLSGVLSGNYEAKDIFINSLQWYADNNVKLNAGVRVEKIDRDNKQVIAADGSVESYDYLVIATGSSPFIPPIRNVHETDGKFKRGVFVFRSLDDCEAITNYAQGKKSAVVIGGGLLGLEAARGLLQMGLEVHVVHLMSHLMEMQLDPQAGATLRLSMEKMGVKVHLQKNTTAILGDEGVTGVRFKDFSMVACEMVVISAGIRPNAQLAKDAGLTVGSGIVVNDAMATEDESIFAVGECAQHRGQVYGLVAPLWEQTAVLADRLTGRKPDAEYTGSMISTKLKVMGIELVVMGDKEARDANDEVAVYTEPTRGVYKKLIIRNGQLGGAILMGDAATAPAMLQAFTRGSILPENRAELLFPLAVGDFTGQVNIEAMPDDTQICNCNGVSKGAVMNAVKGGCRSLKAVCDATRAGTGCGSCKPQVQQVLEFAAGDTVVEDPSVHYYVPGVALSKPALIEAVKENNLRSVSAVFQVLANGKEDPASKVGLASLLKTIWGRDYEDERDARYINDRVHANIQNDRTFSVIPRIYGGVTSPSELRRIADVAEKYDVRMVKLTGGQRIDLLGVKKEDLPNVWREIGMPSGHAYTKAFRTCKTCVGTQFCRYGVGDSIQLGIEIEKRFQGIEFPHKVKLATTGCPRNCSEATTKDIGAVAIEGGKWEILVGGAAGSKVRKGDLLITVDTHEDALKYIGRFMQYYRENAKYLERTYDFLERLGIEKVRRVLVDDEEGIVERLDGEIQAAVDAYFDPWKEAEEPAHPSQFVNILTRKETNAMNNRIRTEEVQAFGD